VQDLAQQPAQAPSEPPSPPATEPLASESPTAEPPEVYMGTEEFRAQVLDLVQDLAQQPAQAPARPAEPTPSEDGAPAPSPSDVSAAADDSPPVPAALFDSTALLAALTPDEILALVGELGLVRAQPGDVVVTEGEPGDSLFLIGSGRVKVFVGSPGGRRFAVGELRDGDFFGEIAALSRRPRAATVTAAEECDLLRLDRDRLEVLTRERPHIREVLEDFYLRRAESPAAAAVRVLPRVDVSTERRAVDILDAYFGESRWDPRVRLRLAQALARAGQEDDAIAILATLADEMARAGFPEKAVALFKKIENLPKAPVLEVKLAPLERPRFREEDMRPAPEAAKDELGRWLVELARDTTPGAPPEDAAAGTGLAPHAYTGLRASPLFDGLTEDDRLALVSGLELKTAAPGDILVTEGEPGETIFLIASGSAKVYVKDADGRSVRVGGLPEGSFFGEVGALSGGIRRATVVASARCELLTLTRDALDGMTARHPRIREILEQYYAERTRS
jgi:CRP-like cAMP-binding protein